MLKHFLNRRAETLVETLISIFLITTAVATATTLIVTSMKANEASKKRIVAINLAREGIEAVRAIRDTNWLVYSNRRRICWNDDRTTPVCIDNDNNGVTDNAISEGYFKIDLSSDLNWELMYYLENDDDDWGEEYRLYLENNFYTHRATHPTSGLDNEKTIFLRRVHISYLDNDGNPGNAGIDDQNNRMVVTSETQFKENGRTHVIPLITRLSDYLGRDNYDD